MIINASRPHRSQVTSIPSGSSLLTGLVSYWKFDESSGTLDDIHSTNDGTNTGASYSATGKINTALAFSTSDYVSMGNPSGLQLTSSGTVACWIYASERTGNVIVSKGNLTDGKNGYILFLSEGYLSGALGNASTVKQVNSSGMVSLTAWHYVAMTWSGTTLTLYVDGTATTGTGLTPVSNVSNFRVGYDNTNVAPFNGTIDELAVWNIALTSTQITTLVNSGSGIPYPFTGY